MNNKKKIFCLQGEQKRGKTSTLIKLWEIILAKYKNGLSDDYVQLFVDAYNYDFVGVITDVEGHKIGINSRGDDFNWIERWNKKLADNNCDIIFCACHQRGKTIDAIKAFEKIGYKVVFIPKEIIEGEKKQEQINKKQAEELLQQANL
ncbi:MAG: hypothetical protein K6G09_09440 [Treponema sp.]|nr:hypothetical protein [Treponema sp.]